MMWSRSIANRTSWTIANQGIVSLSTFILNIQLARGLASADYGGIALLFGAIFALLIVNYSILIYPLSVRIHQLKPDAQAQMFGSVASLSALLALSLGVILAAGLLALGRGDLLISAVLCYLAWQCHETLRRFLFANFRYRSALIGDAVAYGGNVLFVGLLSITGNLALETVLFAMTLAFIAGAICHATQLTLRRPRWDDTIKRARQFAALGAWSLANEEILLFRVQLVPWVLAITTGPATVAVYQAALNIANMMNPILQGLSNLIPQAVAEARLKGGVLHAWIIARKYIYLGLVPILVCCVAALLLPDFLLQLLYGADSPYRDATLAVQILVLAWAAHFIAEMIIRTLFGMEAGKLAMAVNIAGLLAAAILTVPLVLKLDVLGACFALLIANLVRLPVAWFALNWLIADERSERVNNVERAVS